MATPRFSGPPGQEKPKPFGKLSKQAKKSGPQPPIPTKKPATKTRPSAVKPGAPSPGMKGFGGKQ